MRNHSCSLLALSLLSAAVLAAGGRAAWAQNRMVQYPGIGCQPFNDEDDLSRADTTLRNNSSGTRIVFCPAVFVVDSRWPFGVIFPFSASVNYEDKNGSSGDANAFKCRAIRRTDNGATETGAWRYSCSTRGGCASATTGTFKGNLNLVFSGNFSEQTNLVPDGSAIGIECQIPNTGSTLWGYHFTLSYQF